MSAFREENEKLRSETREIAARLEAAEASQEVLRSQISSLEEVNTSQREDVNSLRAQVSEAQLKYDRLVEDSNAEKAALKVQISDLEVGFTIASGRGLNPVVDTCVVWIDTTGTVKGHRC